jgi:preprotein translocase subunit SecG
MYQQSRKVLAFLLVIFLPIRIANAVMTAIMTTQVAAEEFILSSTYQCVFDYSGEFLFLDFMTWILGTVWEVFALCLAVWIAVKHFHELRRHSTGSITGDCFTVLMKTHVIYFASFVAVPCFHIGFFTPTVAADQYSLKSRTYIGLDQIFQIVQMFELGPRLILGVREYHAELVANYVVCSAGDARHDCFLMALFFIHWSSHWFPFLYFVSCISANMHRHVASVDLPSHKNTNPSPMGTYEGHDLLREDGHRS